MKYFPVNTALYDSPKKLRSIFANPDDVIADSDSEKASVSFYFNGNLFQCHVKTLFTLNVCVCVNVNVCVKFCIE